MKFMKLTVDEGLRGSRGGWRVSARSNCIHQKSGEGGGKRE